MGMCDIAAGNILESAIWIEGKIFDGHKIFQCMTHLCSSSPSKDKSLGKNWERLRMNTKSTEHQQHDGIIFPSLQCNLPVQLCNAHCLRLIPVKVAVVDKILFSGALSSMISDQVTLYYCIKTQSFKNNQEKRVDCLDLVCHTNKTSSISLHSWVAPCLPIGQLQGQLTLLKNLKGFACS